MVVRSTTIEREGREGVNGPEIGEKWGNWDGEQEV